jgi:hypothetical protein
MAKSKKLGQKGGGAVGTFANIIYKGTLYLSLFMMMIVPLLFLGVLIGIYFLMNGILAGTNMVIDGLNAVITPIVRGVINMVNGIIRAINSITG